MAGRFDELWTRTQREIPGARIVLRKDSVFLAVVFGVLGWLLKIVTFGKKTIDYSGFATTVGRTIYVPDDWSWRSDDARYRCLRHELVHLRQIRRWPMPFLGHRGVWRINAALMGICYVLVLPVFFTMRAHFERAGYTQSMLVRWERTRYWDTPLAADRYADHMAETFGSGTYAWMWTRHRARKWALRTIEAIKDGRVTNDRDNVDARGL